MSYRIRYAGGLKLVKVLIYVWRLDDHVFKTIGEESYWLSKGATLLEKYWGWDKA